MVTALVVVVLHTELETMLIGTATFLLIMSISET